MQIQPLSYWFGLGLVDWIDGWIKIKNQENSNVKNYKNYFVIKINFK